MRDIRPVYDRRLGDESLWRLEELDVFLRVAVDEVYWPNRIEPLEFGEHKEAPFLSLRWWSHGCWSTLCACEMDLSADIKVENEEDSTYEMSRGSNWLISLRYSFILFTCF